MQAGGVQQLRGPAEPTLGLTTACTLLEGLARAMVVPPTTVWRPPFMMLVTRAPGRCCPAATRLSPRRVSHSACLLCSRLLSTSAHACPASGPVIRPGCGACSAKVVLHSSQPVPKEQLPLSPACSLPLLAQHAHTQHDQGRNITEWLVHPAYSICLAPTSLPTGSGTGTEQAAPSVQQLPSTLNVELPADHACFLLPSPIGNLFEGQAEETVHCRCNLGR